MSRFTVLVTDGVPDDLEIEREQLGGDVDFAVLSDDPDERRSQLENADALLNGLLEIDADMISHLADCRVIARRGIGYDNVDVEAASERGIYVTNVRTYCIEEVATHALALLLDLARRIKHYDAAVAAGEWESDTAPPITARLSTQTIGIVGYGRIGGQVGEYASAFADSILAADPYLEPGDVEPHAELVDLDDLLARSDFVTIHTPLTDETRGLFDADAFRAMKDDASLVNVARGPIVDEDALLDALDAGEIAGAGLDVFEEEPLPPDHPLRGREDVIVTPHQAWYSEVAREEVRALAAANIRQALDGERPDNAVNDV